MLYEHNADLPKSVRDNLPKGAQAICRKAFNNAWEQYGRGKRAVAVTSPDVERMMREAVRWPRLAAVCAVRV